MLNCFGSLLFISICKKPCPIFVEPCFKFIPNRFHVIYFYIYMILNVLLLNHDAFYVIQGNRVLQMELLLMCDIHLH